MKGWVKGIIAGSVIAVIGIAVLIVGLALNNWKYAYGMPDFENKTFDATSINGNVSVEMNAGRVKTEFYDGELIQIDYPFADNYVPNIIEENGKLTYTGPSLKWYMHFGWNNARVPFTTIRLPKNGIYNLEIEVNAGTVEIAQGEYGNIAVEVNAGAFSVAEITCNKFNCEVHAGAVNIESLTCNLAYCEVSAGACNLKKLNCPDITAEVSAGGLTMTIDGVKTDYNITASKSAGSCNVASQNGTTDKKLKIDVSAGSATINFSN